MASSTATEPLIRLPHRQLIYRHSVIVRICHWINVLCLTILLMSGLQIFNAHPALYWGKISDFAHPAMSMTADQPANGAAMGTRLPGLGDPAGRPIPGRRAALALLLRLAVRPERHDLPAGGIARRPSPAGSASNSPAASLHRPHHP
jgi:hypothetical protein